MAPPGMTSVTSRNVLAALPPRELVPVATVQGTGSGLEPIWSGVVENISSPCQEGNRDSSHVPPVA
jgi:hypothetical protein